MARASSSPGEVPPLDRLRVVRANPATLARLRGGTVSPAGGPGWVVVAADGFALGRGKRVGATAENRLPGGRAGADVVRG